MTLAREQALRHWVQQQLNDPEPGIFPLAGDASFRRYARIKSPRQGDAVSYMLMDAPPDKENSLPFVQIAAWLHQHGVRVPRIMAADLQQGFILLEDFGDTLLSQVLTQHTVTAYYQQAMHQLIELQQLIPVPAPAFTCPPVAGSSPIASHPVIAAYDASKLIDEMKLFEEWFIGRYLQLDLNSSEQHLLAQTYTLLADSALSQPQVLVHRDYHSRNLMVLKEQNTLGIIDFQDAVTGAYSYDLVSLLRDAYVQWPAGQVQEWLAYFWQQLPAHRRAGKTLSDFQREFDFMAAQRHLKVLGIFVRLNLRDGKTGYMHDLPAVMAYLLAEIKGYAPLAAFEQWLTERVVPAYLARQPQAQAALDAVMMQGDAS